MEALWASLSSKTAVEGLLREGYLEVMAGLVARRHGLLVQVCMRVCVRACVCVCVKYDI